MAFVDPMTAAFDTGPRRLDEDTGGEDDSSGNTTIILNTLRVYGIFYAVSILLFEFLRRRYPRLYSIRSWVPAMECALAKERYAGLFSWIWRVYQVPDEDIFDQCGMDALCFLRAMRFCRNLATVGVFNALWLLPTYKTARSSIETDVVTDSLDVYTLANVPNSSLRFFAPVLAAYIMVFYTMYLLSKEFEWYTHWRHKFLSRRRPRNYSVYVYGIPKDYRSSFELAGYFRNCSSEAAVLEAHLGMDTPHLEKLQMEREKIIQRLEHTAAVEKREGKKLTHRKGPMLEKVDTVRFLESRLDELNTEIPKRIRAVRAQNDRMRSKLIKSRSARDVVGSIDMVNSLDGLETDLYLSQPTIDENFSLVCEKPGDASDSHPIIRGGTSETMNDVEEGFDAPLDDMSDSNSPEAVAPVDTDNQTYENGFGNDHRAFLSLFLPGSESLLPIMNQNTEPGQISTTSIPGPIDHEDDESQVDLIAEEIAAEGEVCEVDEEAPEPVYEYELPTTGEGDEPAFRSTTSASNPGVGSRTSSAASVARSTTSSQGSRGALVAAGKTLVKGTSAARHSIAHGTRAVGKGLSHGTKLTRDTLSKGTREAGKTLMSGSKAATGAVMKAAKDMKVDRLVHHAGNFVPIVMNKGEGEPRSGGFVVFTNLYATQTALQMVHHSLPYTMEVQEAPSPEDVYWKNVGMKPSKRRLGSLYSTGASTVLCFFWSIPTAFIASLTSVGALKEDIPRLGDLVDKYPWLEQVLVQLAPMLLLFLNEVFLPEFLKMFATWEGHISSVDLEASLFLKLSQFMIIQTFFVSAISGSIYAELTNMVKNPERIIDLLSTSLPSQATYFMQIIFAATFLLQAIEMLRLYPLGCAVLRRFVGPRATAKERKKPWLYIYTLEEPPEFWHAETFAQIQILYIMVLLVYAVIAPFTACALLLCFVLLEAGYRYQFIHNYPVAFDTGGKLWFTFVQFVLASLLIAELTLAGLLSLKQSTFAGPAMGPLIVITVLFIMFINSRHSHVMKFLPTRDCIEIDQANKQAGNTDFTFAKDMYLQPTLKTLREDPDYEDESERG